MASLQLSLPKNEARNTAERQGDPMVKREVVVEADVLKNNLTERTAGRCWTNRFEHNARVLYFNNCEVISTKPS